MASDASAIVGQRVRELRVARGLSQLTLGAAVGLTAGMVSRLERGDRGLSVNTLFAVAAALGCDMAQLFASPSGGTLLRVLQRRKARRAAPARLAPLHVVRCASGMYAVPLAPAELRGSGAVLPSQHEVMSHG